MQLQMRHHKRAFSYDYDVIYHYNSVFKRIKKTAAEENFHGGEERRWSIIGAIVKARRPPSLVSRQFLNHFSKYVNTTTTYLPTYFAYQELLHYGPDHMLSLVIDRKNSMKIMDKFNFSILYDFKQNIVLSDTHDIKMGLQLSYREIKLCPCSTICIRYSSTVSLSGWRWCAKCGDLWKGFLLSKVDLVPVFRENDIFRGKVSNSSELLL